MISDKICVNCGKSHKEHALANYANGPHVGENVLICFRSTFSEELSDVSDVKFLHCSSCGKCVSTGFIPVPTDTPDKGLVIRAWIECPECIEKNDTTHIRGTNFPQPKGTECTSCNGTGIVEDPHHGHAMRCERCNGQGWKE